MTEVAEGNVILTAAGVIVLLAAAASALYVLVVQPGRKLSQIAEKFGQFWDDWNGVEERPGVPGRAGVMVRLQRMEEQLYENHGTSLRDAVNRTESAVRRVEDALAAHLTEHRLAAAQQVVINTTAVHADVPREVEGSYDNSEGES
ncbi:hypothetical protein HNP84_009762 [Thermocatellispora tengchongensis]|uniref:Uncharacterized protein n=1 Tax=Thermocatellispora tengchongensis TaxID=1073253 RepID=A0A840PS95_9ACTN|nr:hypothetical protein [Thermocatellispora tengchongensis]MBB5139997.1 hypothetical protein [Thermocatellispora tengchongensis]